MLSHRYSHNILVCEEMSSLQFHMSQDKPSDADTVYKQDSKA